MHIFNFGDGVGVGEGGCFGISLLWYDMAILYRIKAALHVRGDKDGFLIKENKTLDGNTGKEKLDSYLK